MSWRGGVIIAAFFVLSLNLLADDAAIWREYNLVHTQTSQLGKLSVTTYQMKDSTGALAAWEWMRPPDGKPCDRAPFCSADDKRMAASDYNYLVIFDGGKPTKAQTDAVMQALPNKRDSSPPAILTFLPRNGIVPNSARYILGPASLGAFAPALGSAKPGFEIGAEAQVADYQLAKADKPVRLAIFYYATPEMARLHAADLKRLPDVRVKRSGVLVALALPPATVEQGDTLLSRIQYEAKVTWNDTPPPSPIKPMYQLLLNIVYLSVVLTCLCLVAGLIYAGMRLYRRRHGTLESDEAMTTLHLTGD